ncbi:MAG: hypothetical protein ABR576_08475 [Thermoanaerobaculia bacterium]
MSATPSPRGPTARQTGLLFLLLLFLRIAVAAQFRGNYDSASFWVVSDLALRGENIYAATERYNYSPLWAWVLAGVKALSGGSPGLFVLFVGLLATAVDVVTAELVRRLALRKGGATPEGARRAALLFFSNPVSVLISSAHGQFDGLSILFLLAALLRFRPDGPPQKEWSVAGFLSLSLLFKHVTLFHPLLFWRGLRAGGMAAWRIAGVYAVFLGSFLPYLGAAGSILQNVFLYPARLGGNRLQYPVSVHAFATGAGTEALATAVLLGGVALTLLATRRAAPARAALLLLLAVFAFSPGFSAQYLVWPIALGSLYPSAAFGLFTAVGAIHHSFDSLRFPWPVAIQPLGAWAAGVAWYASELAALRKSARWEAGGVPTG